jgi:hypothetical protein
MEDTLSFHAVIQDVLGEVNILGDHSIGHPKQKNVCVHVSYSERFPRQRYFTEELSQSI